MRKLLLLSIVACGCSLQTDGTSAEGEALADSAVSVDSTSGDDTSVAIDDTGEAPDTNAIDSSAPPVDSGVPPVDSGKPDTAKPDTSVVDTSMPDTFVPDTFVPDTFMPDTFVPDTFVPDTFVPDTFVPDTFMPDTAVMDTGPEAPPPSLTVTTTALSSYDVDLTTAGVRDWAHWGLGGMDGFNHRAATVSLITKGTRVGGVSFESLVYRFSWTNGDPVLAVSDTRRGLQFDNPGDGASFTAKGDPFLESTLDVWMSATGGNTTVTGTLTDATASTATTSIGAGVHLITFKFRPATAAGSVKVDIKKTDGANYSSFFAAAVR